jgi:hypothetical protein
MQHFINTNLNPWIGCAVCMVLSSLFGPEFPAKQRTSSAVILKQSVAVHPPASVTVTQTTALANSPALMVALPVHVGYGAEEAGVPLVGHVTLAHVPPEKVSSPAVFTELQIRSRLIAHE